MKKGLCIMLKCVKMFEGYAEKLSPEFLIIQKYRQKHHGFFFSLAAKMKRHAVVALKKK